MICFFGFNPCNRKIYAFLLFFMKNENHCFFFLFLLLTEIPSQENRGSLASASSTAGAPRVSPWPSPLVVGSASNVALGQSSDGGR